MGILSGTLAASVTPLRDGGEAVDHDAIGPVVDFLVNGGVDGILAMGTTGEGIMLSPDERRHALERFAQAAAGRVRIVAHCGAQTTGITVSLAAHAPEAGADAVAVIAPPYYPFDEESLLDHFRAAARACHPLPFYVYEFADRSGYAVPTTVLARLREVAENFAGMKVSDAPFVRFEPYLLEGLDVLVGPEALIVEGLERGAVGAVSGLAAAFPEPVVRLVKRPAGGLGAQVAGVRAALQRLPVPGAMKAALALRGVPVRGDVRRPLRALTVEERAEVAALVDGLVAAEAIPG